jgi:tetratricopeptide (TPR) repeat protein
LEQEKVDQAEPLLQAALVGLEAKRGAHDTDVLTCKSNLASVYSMRRKDDLAEPLYTEVLAAQTAKFGADHPATLMTKNNLAGLYRDQKNYDLAEPLYQDAVKGFANRFGLDHPSTVRVRGNLARLYSLMNAPDKEEPVLREVVESARRTAGDASPLYTEKLVLLGLNLLKQQNWRQAELVARECLTVRERTVPDAWTTFNTRSMLGEALAGQEKYADAEPLLLAGYDGMQHRKATIPPQGQFRLVEGLRRLVDFYVATDQAEKADEWRAKLEAATAKEP